MVVIYMEYYEFSLHYLINNNMLNFFEKVNIFKQVRGTLLFFKKHKKLKKN